MTGEGATGVVLAGGDSSRFGSEDKALATYDGVPFVERVVSSVAEATGRDPVVAVREPAQRRAIESVLTGADPTFVTDASGFEGPLAGVGAGVRAASTPWLFVCGCDMPLLSPDAISWLGTQCGPTVDAVVPETAGGFEPLHAFYRRESARRALSSLPSRAGLQALLGELDSLRTVAPSDAPEGVALAESIENVNTRPELAALTET